MKKKMWTAILVGLSLTMLVMFVGRNVAADDEVVVPAKMKDQVFKMADAIAKGKTVDKEADQYVKDFAKPKDLKNTMYIFKPREKDDKGGVGVGPKPGMYRPDGIEALMKNQNSRTPSMTLDLKKSADDINRMLDITLAITEITARTPPPKDKKAPAKLWKESVDDMRKATLDLKAAVKDGDKTKFKQALLALDASCNKCHTNFREDE
jgi:hypothetical protein